MPEIKDIFETPIRGKNTHDQGAYRTPGLDGCRSALKNSGQFLKPDPGGKLARPNARPNVAGLRPAGS